MGNGPKRLAPRKLLVAAVGVATVNYVAIACGGILDNETSGNLPAPRDYDAAPPTSGNLPAPQPRDAMPPPTSGNLPAPIPIEAGADAGDGGDAG